MEQELFKSYDKPRVLVTLPETLFTTDGKSMYVVTSYLNRIAARTLQFRKERFE